MNLQAFSLTFDSFAIERLLRRESIDRLVLVLKIVLITATAIALIWFLHELWALYRTGQTAIKQAAAITAQRVEATPGSTTITPKRIDYQAIARRSIFGQLDSDEDNNKPGTDAPPISKIDLTLIGTFVTNGEQPYAIIEDKKNKQQEVFMLNDQLFEDQQLKLVGIFSDRVEIDRAGTREILKLDDTIGDNSSDHDQNVVTVKEQDLDEALDNLPMLLTQARAVPFFQGGKSVGLRLFAIKRGSMFEKVGLKNGDVLKSINGNSLGDITQAVKLFEKLREERSINLLLERGRQEQTIRYEIR